jgi:hypothetical protein
VLVGDGAATGSAAVPRVMRLMCITGRPAASRRAAWPAPD